MKKFFLFAMALALSNLAPLQAQNLEVLFEDVKQGARLDLSNPDHRAFFQIYLISNFQYPTRMSNLKMMIEAQQKFVLGQNLYETKINFDHFDVRMNTQNYEKNETSRKVFAELWSFRNNMITARTDNPAWTDIGRTDMIRILSASYEKAFGETFSGIDRDETKIKKINNKLKNGSNIEGWYKALAEEVFASWRIASGKYASSLEKLLVNLIKTYGLRDAGSQKMFNGMDGQAQFYFLEKVILDEGREFCLEKLNKKSLYTIYEGKVKSLLKQITNLRTALKPTISATKNFRFRLFTPYESGYISMVSSHCSTESPEGVETHSIKPLYVFGVEEEGKVTKGMITLVLGTADEGGRSIKVAVIEQVDDISENVLPTAIEAIRRIVKEHGYTLSVLTPIEYGSSSVSNTSSINDALEKSTAVRNSRRILNNFKPEAHKKPEQTHSDSRIYKSSNVLVLAETELPDTSVVTLRKNPRSTKNINFNLKKILDEASSLLMSLAKNEAVDEESAKELVRFLRIASGLADMDIPELNEIKSHIFDVAPKVFGRYQSIDVEILQLFEKSGRLNEFCKLLIEKGLIPPEFTFKFVTNYAQFLWKVPEYNFDVGDYLRGKNNFSKTPMAAYLHILGPLLDGYLRTPSAPSWIGSYYGAVHQLSAEYARGTKNNPMTLSYAFSIWFGNTMKNFILDPSVSDGQKIAKIDAIKTALGAHYKKNNWKVFDANSAEILIILTGIFNNKQSYDKLGNTIISMIKGLTGLQQGNQYSLDPIVLKDIGVYGIILADLETLYALENVGYDTRTLKRFPDGQETPFSEAYRVMIEDGVVSIAEYYKSAGSFAAMSTETVHRKIAKKVGEIKEIGFWNMETWSLGAGATEVSEFEALIRSDPSKTFIQADNNIDWDAIYNIKPERGRSNRTEDFNSGLAGGLGVKTFENLDAFLWSLLPQQWKYGLDRLPHRLKLWVQQQFSKRVLLIFKKIRAGEKNILSSLKEVLLRIVNQDGSINISVLKPTDVAELTEFAQKSLVDPVEESMERGYSDLNQAKDFNEFKAEFKKVLEKGLSGKGIALQQVEFVLALWIIKFVEKLSSGLPAGEAMAKAMEEVLGEEHLNGLLGFAGASTALNVIGFQTLRKAINVSSVAKAMKYPLIQKLTLQFINSGSMLAGMHVQQTISNLYGLHAIRAMAIKRYLWGQHYEKLAGKGNLPAVFGSLSALSKEGSNAALWEPHFSDINRLMMGFDPDYKNDRVTAPGVYNYIFLQKLKLQLMNNSDLRAEAIKRFDFKAAAQDTAIILVSHLSSQFLTRGMPVLSTILTLSMVGLIKAAIDLEKEKIPDAAEYLQKQTQVNDITSDFERAASKLYIPMQLKESDLLAVEPLIEKFEIVWLDLEDQLRKRIYMATYSLSQLQAYVQEKLGIKIQDEMYATNDQLTPQDMKKIEQALMVVAGHLDYYIGERWKKGLPMCTPDAILTSHEYLGRKYEKHLQELECQVAMLRSVANKMRSIVRSPSGLTQKLEKMVLENRSPMNEGRTTKPLEHVIQDHYIRMSQTIGKYEDVAQSIRETLTEMRHILPMMVVHRSMEANEEGRKPKNAYIDVKEFGNFTRIISTIPDKEFALSTELLAAVYNTSNILIDWKKVKRAIHFDEVDNRFEMDFDFKNLQRGQNYYLKVFSLDNSKEGEPPSLYLNIPFKTKAIRGQHPTSSPRL